MDPIRNPYAPGAGTPPPELAGRDDFLHQAGIAMARIRAGRPARSTLMIGLRGVGKTVMLDRLCQEAGAAGLLTLRMEAPEERSLPALLAPQLRSVLLRLSAVERAKSRAHRALKALAGFAKALKVTYNDIEVGLDFDPEPGLADNGDLAQDLLTLIELVGETAKADETAVALFIDELQYVPEDQLAALVTALHRAAQRELPVVLVGAGLPQLPGQLGKAKSYAERLFNFTTIGPLTPADARAALVIPARQEGGDFTDEALARIVSVTAGYPYFIQEWGKHAWDVAEMSPITLADVELATRLALVALDDGFFRVRLDRLTPAEKTYLRAMAALGPGPHRSADVATALKRDIRSVAPTRSNLIRKGMAWSPGHGDVAFTVPLFDEYMRRVMP